MQPNFIKAILDENISGVKRLIAYENDLNQLDIYGFTPLIEAAIVDSHEISMILLEHGAHPNFKDAVGNTPLHWAVENNNIPLAKTLLQAGANPNEFNFSGQPILVIPTLRRYLEMRHLLLDHGADPYFSLDFINTKLIGHLFELTGYSTIISPNNQFVEVDFEGYYLETTLGLISSSLFDFQNHFASRRLKRYQPIIKKIVKIILNGLELIKLQQYRVQLEKHQEQIQFLLNQEPILIPVGYEGHAITFIKFFDLWIKCDRREDSRLYDNIVIYRIQNPTDANHHLFKKLIYGKQTYEFINVELNAILNLKPLTEIKISPQKSGNCSWANVEAAIPTLLFLFLECIERETIQKKTRSIIGTTERLNLLLQTKSTAHISSKIPLNPKDPKTTEHKNASIHFFHHWREWAKDKALEQCYYYFNQSDPIRKATKAEMLAAILFHRMDEEAHLNEKRIDDILNLLIENQFEHLLYNYQNVYYFNLQTEKGKKFAELLKRKGIHLKKHTK